MSKPLNLDDRITCLVPEIDPSIREELQRILQTLRRADYPVGVIQMMSRLALRLFRRIYDAAGHPFPSDNLFDVIVRAGDGDRERGVNGYRILPDALDSPLHTLRVLSNKIDHGVEKFPMGVEEAELVLNAFLSVLKWFHCESGLTPLLPSIYAGLDGRQGHTVDAEPDDESADDVGFTLRIGRDFSSFSDGDQAEIVAAVLEERDAAAPPASPAPVTATERFTSIDMVRGFALLGILPMNVTSFGLPWPAYLCPPVAGGFTGLNFAEWVFAFFVFEEKMMTIFSMLFGAGLVLLTDRAEARGGSPAKFFYRRAAILLVFGLLHAYLLWEGDILFDYALCGMLVYPFRKKSPRTLFLLGVLVLVPGLLIGQGLSIFMGYSRQAAARVEAARSAGQTPAPRDQGFAQAWNGFRDAFEPPPEEVSKEIEVHRHGTYLEIARARIPFLLMAQTVFFMAFTVWGIAGRMLIGMALLKLGVFSAERSKRFYLALMMVGFGLGWPLIALECRRLIQQNFGVERMIGGFDWNQYASILVALGYVGALILIYKSGVLAWLMRRLAAVGRMALSNYLMHTMICTTIFNGYGQGRYASLDRIQLMGIVLAIWVFQLWYSPVWLKYFRFGPAEWLWRSLTYGKAQPLRITPVAIA
jgi:uncharacterized protein